MRSSKMGSDSNCESEHWDLVTIEAELFRIIEVHPNQEKVRVC